MSPTTHNILVQAAPLRLANTKRNMPLKRSPSHIRQRYVVLLQLMLGICLGFSVASSASAKTQLIGSLIDQQRKPPAALSELLTLTDVQQRKPPAFLSPLEPMRLSLSNKVVKIIDCWYIG